MAQAGESWVDSQNVALFTDLYELTMLQAYVEEGLTEPDDIAAAILGHLRAALAEIEAVADELAETEEVEA